MGKVQRSRHLNTSLLGMDMGWSQLLKWGALQPPIQGGGQSLQGNLGLWYFNQETPEAWNEEASPSMGIHLDHTDG